MLAAERRQLIAKRVHREGSVRIQDLCPGLGVSASTIRRDLDHLERQGLLVRTHGGAIAPETERDTPTSTEDAYSPQRMQIGAAVADLIEQGQTVFLGPGAAMLAVAHHLAGKPGVTVVTNALNVAAHLSEQSLLPVIVIGGQLERKESALLGHIAEGALRELRADRAVIHAAGMHVPDGITAENLAVAQLLRTVIELIPEVIVVVESAQWGRTAPAYLAPVDAIDVVVTERAVPLAMVWDLTELGIKVIQA
jgi:DeoR/GlpR family transcriptional regulator of sugar metabolism